MKKLIAGSVLFGLSLMVVPEAAVAAPTPENHQVVVFHEGDHIIPIAPENRTIDNWWVVAHGWDMVMRAGKSGNFQQWFINGEVGYHSVWNMTKNGKCPPKAEIIYDAKNNGWGDYLVEGADYCVITNEFAGTFPGSWL